MKKLEQSRVITATNRWAKEHKKKKRQAPVSPAAVLDKKRQSRVLQLARRYRKKRMSKRLAIEKAIEQEEWETLLKKI